MMFTAPAADPTDGPGELSFLKSDELIKKRDEVSIRE
jgi:hypothetical protein